MGALFSDMPFSTVSQTDQTLRPPATGGGGMASPLLRFRKFGAGAASGLGAAAAAPLPRAPLASTAARPAAAAAGCPETTPKEPTAVPWLASGSSDMPKLRRLRIRTEVVCLQMQDCRTTHENERPLARQLMGIGHRLGACRV